MELLELVIMLLIATLVSSVLDETLPHLSLPLVQIVLGIAIVVIQPSLASVSIDPELFLVLFIAPLLFDETRHADKLALWRNKWPIVSLAIGLVLVCILVVGFATHILSPSIQLASAFALGAALGPTDAAAVAALGKDVKLTSRQKALLSGEALINDASGVVGFQFAIAAAVTGAFSVLDAGQSFLLNFFGGIIIGLFLGAVMRLLKRVLRETGLENATVSTLIEVISPFLFFLIAEHFHVSGILAVVAGGLLMNMRRPNANVNLAKANIVSNNVWEMLVFIINGVVFVTLGMQLPGGISPTWEDVRFSTTFLLSLVLLITLVITVVRFIWLLVIELLAKPENELADPATGTIILDAVQAQQAKNIDPFADPLERKRLEEAQRRDSERIVIGKRNRSLKEMCHSALVTTLAGPKGAVTFSVIMTIPIDGSVPFRNMLIFLAAGVIVCTLLMANFLLPLLAKGDGAEPEGLDAQKAQIRILRSVISELRDEMTETNEKATKVVIKRYSERIRVLRASTVSPKMLRELRLKVLEQQQDVVHSSIVEGKVDKVVGQRYADKLKRMHKSVSRGGYVSSSVKALLPKRHHARIQQQLKNKVAVSVNNTEAALKEREQMYCLVVKSEKVAIRLLEDIVKESKGEMANSAAFLLAEHKNLLTTTQETHKVATIAATSGDMSPLSNLTNVMHAERNAENLKVKEMMAEGYRIELEKIQDARSSGAIDRQTARELREEVYLLQMDASDALDD